MKLLAKASVSLSDTPVGAADDMIVLEKGAVASADHINTPEKDFMELEKELNGLEKGFEGLKKGLMTPEA